eukprot:gb/GECG01005276.1/.p1 GENE.gb/GECG01005276.1/~~gb/GECG01005276.1/.p1  ORF type:complete len:1109 (+),score=154.50 gb/GECG01005276.1/:1-3327(+)
MASDPPSTSSSGYAFSTGDGGVFGTSDLPSQQDGALQESEKLYADYYSTGPNETVTSTAMNSGGFDDLSNTTGGEEGKGSGASEYNATSQNDSNTTFLGTNQMMGSQLDSVKAILEKDDSEQNTTPSKRGSQLDRESTFSSDSPFARDIYSSLHLEEVSDNEPFSGLRSDTDYNEENEEDLANNSVSMEDTDTASNDHKLPGRIQQFKGRLGRESGKPMLSVRVPAPVQYCKCSPFLLVRDNDGNMIELDSDRIKLQFRWYRSKSFRKCANPRCSRTGASDANSGKIQCFPAATKGIPSEFTYFCGTECLKQCWPVEAAAAYASCVDMNEADSDFSVLSLATLLASSGSKTAFSEDMDTKSLALESIEAADQLGSLEAAESKQFFKARKSAEKLSRRADGDAAEPTITDDNEEWALVSLDREYTPRLEDVWHSLKVVVTATLDDSHVVRRHSNAQYAFPFPPFASTRQYRWNSSVRAAAVKAAADSLRRAFQNTSGTNMKGGIDFQKVLTNDGEYNALIARLAPYLKYNKNAESFSVSLPPALKPLLRFRSPPKPQNDAIRVLSYNSLAEIYATQAVYPYCPSWALQWPYRWRRLHHEIQCLDADIICLQEAQADHFESDVLPAMEELGYKGLYKQKTREPMGMTGKIDGCAMFYKASRFRLKEKYVIEYNEAAMAVGRTETEAANSLPSNQAHDRKARISSIRNALQRLLRDNVAQITLLEMFADASGKPLAGNTALPVVVANTHLFWDPGYGDVKLWQTNVLLNQLNKFLRQQRKAFKKDQSPHKGSARQKFNDVPLILCGDFNSEPHSAVHRFLGQNSGYHIDQNGNLLTSMRGGDVPTDPSAILPSPESLSHDIPLVSSYAAVNGDEPSYTNVTRDYTGCIDYIWFSADALEAAGVLQMPSLDELTHYAGSPLPNSQWPSDHLCLCTDFVPAAAPASQITPRQLSHLYNTNSSLRKTPVQQKTHDMSIYTPESEGQSVFASVAIEDTGESEMLQDTEDVAMSSWGSRRVALHNTSEISRQPDRKDADESPRAAARNGGSPSASESRRTHTSGSSGSSLARQMQSRLRMQGNRDEHGNKKEGIRLEPRGIGFRRQSNNSGKNDAK